MNPIVPLGLAAGLGGLLYLRSQKKTAGAAAGASGASQYAQAAWHSNMSVSDVQHALNALGAQPPLVEDGQAGPKTQAAIRSFQAQSGITVDGVVGPETTAALEHAVGAHGVVAGEFDEEDDVEYVGQNMAHALMRKGAIRGATAIEREDECGEPIQAHGLHIIGGPWFDEDEGETFAVGAGYDESSNDWGSPDVNQILRDPAQMEAIGMQQLWKQKAEAAFGPGTAYGYDYGPITQQDLTSAQQLATSELGGGSTGGVYLAGEFDEEDEDEESFVGWEGDEEDDDVNYVGACCWSAPDIGEALSDPEQVAEMYGMAARSMPYGYSMPYAYEPPMFAPQAAYPYGYPNMPVNPYYPGSNNLGPAAYPYGPLSMGAPVLNTIAPPTAGGVPVGGGVTVVPGEGYEFQSQAGRNY